jgi:hypothetical protein
VVIVSRSRSHARPLIPAPAFRRACEQLTLSIQGKEVPLRPPFLPSSCKGFRDN